MVYTHMKFYLLKCHLYFTLLLGIRLICYFEAVSYFKNKQQSPFNRKRKRKEKEDKARDDFIVRFTQTLYLHLNIINSLYVIPFLLALISNF